MKRFMMIVACASIVLATFLASQAQERDRTAQVDPLDKLKVGPKYAVADLAVIEFAGAYDGTNYNLGGKVQNVGSGAYTRTRSTSGAIEGRQIHLSVVPKSKLGRYKRLRTIAIPPLKAKEIWTIPAMTISPNDVFSGPGNAEFLLGISAGDDDRANDWKTIMVSLVR